MKPVHHAFILAAALLSSLLGSAAARPQAPARAAAPGPGNAQNGKKAFMTHTCYSCHGYSAEGGAGARLVGFPGTLDGFTAYLRKPTGTMPPAGAKISAQELADIYTWIRSLPPLPDAKTIDLLKP